MRQSEINRHVSGRRWSRDRRGLTLLELIIVLAVTSTLAAIFWKPMQETFDESSRRAASREVASYLIRARSAAVQRGRQTWFVRTGNTIKIVTDSSGTKVVYGKPLQMFERHGVTMLATQDSVSFDSRGFTTLIVPTPRFIVQAATGADTLCVTGLGTISTRRCS